MGTEFVTNRQWDSCVSRIVNKNFKDRGHSLTRSAISRRANSFIVDIRDDQKGMIVKVGWKDAMKGE